MRDLYKKFYKRLRQVAFVFRTRRRTINILWYPPIESDEDFSREAARAVWYLNPVRDRIGSVTFLVGETLNSQFPTLPDYADPEIMRIATDFRQKLIFTRATISSFNEYDIVVKWVRTDSHDCCGVGLFYPYFINGDVAKNQFEANHMMQLCNVAATTRFFGNASGDNALSRLIWVLRRGRFDYTLLLGSGPSLAGVETIDVDNERVLSVICNSVIKNKELLERLKPKIIVATDAVFHSGYSKYAGEFRRYLIEALDMLPEAMFVVLERDLLLFKKNLPVRFESRIVGVRSRRTRRFNLDLNAHKFVRATSNVLTVLMLPLAASVGKRIKLLGFDGRLPDESNGFWQYDPNSQFEQALAYTGKAHPAFYSVNYAHYYQRHCGETKEILDLLDGGGYHIECLMPSNIPALNKYVTSK